MGCDRMIINVDGDTFNKRIASYFNKKGISFMEKIKNFLLDIKVDDDLLNLGRSIFECSLIMSNDRIIGFESFVRPFEVKGGSDSVDNDYYIEKRTVTIDSDGEFIFTRCFSNFYVSGSDKISFDVSVERIVYSDCGVMIERAFGKRRRTILSLFDEITNKVDVYEKSKPIALDIDYNKIFESEILALVSINDSDIILSNEVNNNVVMIVRCERKSHDVAYIRIYKHDSNSPSFYETYFSLDNNSMLDLPDVMFPLHNNHGDYELDCMVSPKAMEQCIGELNNLLGIGKIDKLQYDYLLQLACDNNRSSLEVFGSNYRQGIIGK